MPYEIFLMRGPAEPSAGEATYWPQSEERRWTAHIRAWQESRLVRHSALGGVPLTVPEDDGDGRVEGDGEGLAGEHGPVVVARVLQEGAQMSAASRQPHETGRDRHTFISAMTEKKPGVPQ
jgi:hypothetical protein